MKLNNLINDKRLSKNNINIKGLSENSKEIKNNYIFFLKNTKNFKKKYIVEAINKGAKVIIYKKTKTLNLSKFQEQSLFYEVDDIAKSMSEISRKFFNIKKNSIKIYGVTGTNGKSSVASYISQLLTKNNEKCGIIGTVGSGIYPNIKDSNLTTPNIINICKTIYTFCKKGVLNLAMEVSSHGLSQNRVNGLHFNTVIFTNLTNDHLDYHKNMRNYLNSKLYLFEKLIKKKGNIISDSNIPEIKKIKKIIANKKVKLNLIFKKKGGLELISHRFFNEKQILTLKFNNRKYRIKTATSKKKIFKDT